MLCHLGEDASTSPLSGRLSPTPSESQTLELCGTPHSHRSHKPPTHCFWSCDTPSLWLVLQWLKPRISITSFAGEVGLRGSVLLYGSPLLFLRPLEGPASPRLWWLLNKQTDSRVWKKWSVSNLTPGLVIVEPNYQHLDCPSRSWWFSMSLLWVTRQRRKGVHRDLINFWWLCMCTKSFQSCPTLCDPIDCSPPGSSVHGVL